METNSRFADFANPLLRPSRLRRAPKRTHLDLDSGIAVCNACADMEMEQDERSECREGDVRGTRANSRAESRVDQGCPDFRRGYLACCCLGS